MVRQIKEYIEACRMIWKREAPFDYQGQTVLTAGRCRPGRAPGLGKALKIINHPLR